MIRPCSSQAVCSCSRRFLGPVFRRAGFVKQGGLGRLCPNLSRFAGQIALFGRPRGSAPQDWPIKMCRQISGRAAAGPPFGRPSRRQPPCSGLRKAVPLNTGPLEFPPGKNRPIVDESCITCAGLLASLPGKAQTCRFFRPKFSALPARICKNLMVKRFTRSHFCL